MLDGAPTLGHQEVNGDQVMKEECALGESRKERTGICVNSFRVFCSPNAIGKCTKKSSLQAERIEGSGNKVIIHPDPCSNSSLKTIVSDQNMSAVAGICTNSTWVTGVLDSKAKDEEQWPKWKLKIEKMKQRSLAY